MHMDENAAEPRSRPDPPYFTGFRTPYRTTISAQDLVESTVTKFGIGRKSSQVVKRGRFGAEAKAAKSTPEMA